LSAEVAFQGVFLSVLPDELPAEQSQEEGYQVMVTIDLV
jgi:hypothetical protein